MTVRVRSVPPCVSSQTGSRHLPLKQGSVSSSLTWRTNFYSGCGVTFASESWELVVTVRLCPPRPFRIVGPVGSRHGVANAETPVRIRYDAPICFKSSHPTNKTRVALTRVPRGSDVAGNMRVFQIRLESSNLSFRTSLHASPSG